MMFNRESALVKTWVRLVKAGTYRREDVPKLSNLQTAVWSVLDEENES